MHYMPFVLRRSRERSFPHVVSDVSKLCIKVQNQANVFATLSGFLAKNK